MSAETAVERRAAVNTAVDKLSDAVDDLQAEADNVTDPERTIDLKIALVNGRAALVNALVRRPGTRT